MWNTIQVAVQGRSHVSNGIPCQDKTFVLKKDGCTVISLADGAGSAKYSHYGAEVVIQYACNNITEHFNEYFQTQDGLAVKKQILEGLLECLEITAQKYQCLISDLASTLLLVAVKDSRYILLHIGDGVIGYKKDDAMLVASRPDNGEFANTTVFVTSSAALGAMRLIKGSLGKINGFVLMSDGSESCLYQKRENRLAPIIKSIIEYMGILQLDKVQDMVEHIFIDLVVKKTADDCSIVVMTWNAGNGGFESLPNSEKIELLRLKCESKSAKKRLKRYEAILSFLKTERTLYDIARYLYMAKQIKKVQMYVDTLLELNFIEQNGNKYKAVMV